MKKRQRHRSQLRESLSVHRVLLWAALAAVLLSPRFGLSTVEDQRARLPPPAECLDPVEGEWRSHHYHPIHGEWSQFRLTVERSESDPNQLEGAIHFVGWVAGPEQEQPGPCRGLLHAEVSMDARGRIDGDQIEYWGVGQWRLEALHCGRMPGYNLDHFSGTIDHTLHEFQTVNNDGGRAINETTVFRRVRCAEEASPDEIDFVPPAFFPTDSGTGCAW